MKATAIIAAGGVGERLGVPGGKQLLAIAGRPLAAWAIQAVADARDIDEIIVTCDPDRVAAYEEQLRAAVVTDKPLWFIAGGETRTRSILAAISFLPADTEAVLVNDGARPLATTELMDAVIDALHDAPEDIAGVVVGHPVSDTLKTANEAMPPRITTTVPRDGLWQVQTPQVFKAPALRDAYGRTGQEATDDAGVLEAAGYQLTLVQGPRDNLKVTVPEDIRIIETLLKVRKL